MSEEHYDEADSRQMHAVKEAIVAALIPFTKSTPSWLICLALAKCLRVMVRKAPVSRRKELLPALFAYLRGDTEQPGVSPLLWTPGDDRIN